MSSSSQPLLRHPSLQVELQGAEFPTTIQYRNLKYASIPGRWKDSRPLETLKSKATQENIYDATQFGPSCPHKRIAQTWDLSLLGDISLPASSGQGPDEKMDEFECLHVNVTVPKISSRGKNGDGLLPVFVWVHGGGLSMGSNAWPQYELRKFVERSVEKGKPVIGVSINYRTNVFGFLASKELGATGNYGYKDQALAFRWIKKHIHGFGGDPKNVTAAGESAGGISLSTLLCAEIGEEEALFDRVVIMSGEVSLRKPRGWRWHEEMYRDQLNYLGIQDLDQRDRVKKLKEWNAEDLGEKLPLAQHFCGLVDGVWLKNDGNLSILKDGSSDIHKRTWCREFVIGDTADDGTVLKARILDNPKALSNLHILCTRHLTTSETSSLLSAYHLPTTSPNTKEETATLFPSLRQLASELRFYLPSLTAHRGWKSSSLPKRTGRYHFHVKNPVRGTFQGLSSHELDVAFLLQNFNGHFDDVNRRAAEQMADHFITFAHGEGWSADGKVAVFGNWKESNKIKFVNEADYDDRWRSGRGTVVESIGAEKLWRLAEGWQGVREDLKDGVTRESSKL